MLSISSWPTLRGSLGVHIGLEIYFLVSGHLVCHSNGTDVVVCIHSPLFGCPSGLDLINVPIAFSLKHYDRWLAMDRSHRLCSTALPQR